MFEHLSDYGRILVTGAHRSGTTIAAAMIAADTGKKAVFEEAFGHHDMGRLARIFVSGVVIQAPYALPWLPLFAGKEALLVVMQRDTKDVEASLERLRVSKPWFTAAQAEAITAHHEATGVPLLRLEYEELRRHPMWVPQDRRRRWHHRQIAC